MTVPHPNMDATQNFDLPNHRLLVFDFSLDGHCFLGFSIFQANFSETNKLRIRRLVHTETFRLAEYPENLYYPVLSPFAEHSLSRANDGIDFPAKRVVDFPFTDDFEDYFPSRDIESRRRGHLALETLLQLYNLLVDRSTQPKANFKSCLDFLVDLESTFITAESVDFITICQVVDKYKSIRLVRLSPDRCPLFEFRMRCSDCQLAISATVTSITGLVTESLIDFIGSWPSTLPS